MPSHRIFFVLVAQFFFEWFVYLCLLKILISSFLLEDLINELQITITPHLLGGSYCWVSSELNNLKSIMNNSENWILKETKNLGNNELLLRYFRNN